MLLLESQFQNAFLARYPGAAANLATFALAVSSFQLLNAFLVFVPQTVTILGRCPRSRRTCLRFILAAGLLLSLPLLIMGFLPWGTRLFAGIMRIPPDLLPDVVRYLRWLAPLLLVNAIRHYCTGILVQAGRTRSITLLNLVHLLTLVGVLWLGRAHGWPAMPTLAAATIGANIIHLGLILPASTDKRLGRAGEPSLHPLRYSEIMTFFWPVAVTSGMFAMCRPVMYSFINRTAMAITTVAALRLAFDSTMFFQNPVNQFRHLYTTFGHEDPDGVRRFMLRVTTGLSVAMILLAFSPLGHFMFHRVLGVDGEVLTQALQALRIMCLGPAVIAIRNMYHGQMMVKRRTRGMAAGGTLRVLSIAAMSWSLYHLGWLNHRTSALMLIVGFSAEAFISKLAVARMQKRKVLPPPNRLL